MVLDPEDRKYTINTHRGLFQYRRLPFGIASAPAIFQRAIENILQRIPGVLCFIDDILVTGTSDQEHLERLEEVFKRLEARNLRVKRKKSYFLRDMVYYLGYCISAEGIHTDDENVAAVVNAPRPQNQRQLRSFLGLVNYYGRFIPPKHILSTSCYDLT